MKFIPETCVWELTTTCNLRCHHCASSCSDMGRSDELMLDEKLEIAKQIAGFNIKWVSLTGGEVLLCPDWFPVTRTLEELGVRVHMITNGTLIDDIVIKNMKDAKLSMVSISLDGTEEIHNHMRQKNIYRQSITKLKQLQESGIKTGCITSVTRGNILVLKELKEELISAGVSIWQIQMAVPEGNMRRHREELLKPEQITTLIDMAYEMSLDGQIQIILPDNVGYYTRKEGELRQSVGGKNCVWKGCNAGIRSFGILSNGDITGCTSIRGVEFVEGNIRQRSLRDIWEDPSSFSWRRRMGVEQLGENCSKCMYGKSCLGGCPNTRHTINGSIYSDNPYCAYADFKFFKKRAPKT